MHSSTFDSIDSFSRFTKHHHHHHRRRRRRCSVHLNVKRAHRLVRRMIKVDRLKVVYAKQLTRLLLCLT